MNEVRRKSLNRKIDKEWLLKAAELLQEPVGARGKEELLTKILAIGKEEPASLLLLLHPGTVGLLMQHCGEFIETKITDEEKEKLTKRLLSDLKKVTETDYVLRHPNHAFVSSAGFAELLVYENILPDLLIEWGDEVNEVISMLVIAQEFWNLINYYGVIEEEDLLRMHAASHEEADKVPEGVLGLAQAYMELNLSDEIYFEDIYGKDYFLSEYLGIDAEEILEDIKTFKGDYRVVPMHELMEMLYGIGSVEMLQLVDYITRSFDLTPEDELMLIDVEALHAIIVNLRKRGAEKIPQQLHEELGWEWGVKDLEARELIFQELLERIPRYHLKGHSLADLNNSSDLEEGEEDYLSEGDWMDEFNFKLRQDPPESDDFLN